MLEAKKIAGKPRRLHTAVRVVENIRCLDVSWQSSVFHIRSYVLWKVLREREHQWREGPRNVDAMINFTIWKINLVVSTLGGLIFVKLNREGCMSSILGIWTCEPSQRLPLYRKSPPASPCPNHPETDCFCARLGFDPPTPLFQGLWTNLLKVGV